MTFRNMAFLMAVVTAMVAKAQTERKMTVDELFQLVESNSKTLRQEKISVEFAKKGIEDGIGIGVDEWRCGHDGS